MSDPLFEFQFREIFRLVGSIEIAVALVCYFCKRTWLSSGLVAWLGSVNK
jgi:hypothetical protein